MNRRAILAALGATTAAAAGCLADEARPSNVDDRNGAENGGNGGNDEIDGGGGDESRVLEAFDGEPTRPECDIDPETVEVEYGDDREEHETAETIPYPVMPEGFDEEAVIDYLIAFDEAYLTHNLLCARSGSDRILRIGHSVRERETFDWHEGATTVFLLRAAGATAGVSDDGAVWESDIGFSAVVYVIDSGGVARVDYLDAGAALDPDEREATAPDPLEDGILVATFEGKVTF
ncbi:hypothetical protein [Natronosalvus rutilus]|uniref:Uncharacterized protein n=1 Tax=Natronosalvus rutilus TaxID=2953753 RepID=A0A9E7NB26_9EURY|nr:hypothetical protein [Natronosalvus rutilus]UTF53678.1 hypothetical protein NGM29_18230 [Natronosalvus rutilus]